MVSWKEHYRPYEIRSVWVQRSTVTLQQSSQKCTILGGYSATLHRWHLCRIFVFHEKQIHILFIRTYTHMHTHTCHMGVPREKQVEPRSASLPNTRDRQVGISSKSPAWCTINHQQVPSYSDSDRIAMPKNLGKVEKYLREAMEMKQTIAMYDM